MKIFIFLLFIIGIVVLQIFLSKRESKLPGLILPFISFLFGLLYPLNMVAPSEGVNAGFIVQMIIVWILGNIPTIIFLSIYFGIRGKQDYNKQPEK